jgi:thiol-disulfide isomerase/thioredoxin
MKIWQKVLISLGVALLIVGILYQIMPDSFCRIPMTGSQEDKTDSFFFPRDHKRPVILHFWSSWCPPCLKELEEINDFMTRYPEAPVLLIAEDQDLPEETVTLFERKGWNALKSQIDDKGQLMAKFHLKGLPVTVFVDENQNELARMEGPIHWKNKTLQDLLKMAQSKS